MMPTYSSKQMIRLIQQVGWYQVSQAGSHAQYKHPTLPGRVTIPKGVRDLPVGTVKSVCRQAGLPWPPA